MEESPKSRQSPARLFSGSYFTLTLILAFGITVILWPAFRRTSTVGLNSITRPFLKILFPIEPSKSIQQSSLKSQTARKARSMEFRIQQYPVTPDRIQAWKKEWNCDPTDLKVLIDLLLTRIPGASTSETLPLEHANLIQSMNLLIDEGSINEPDNGFFGIIRGLILFYTNQDSDALESLRKALDCSKLDSGLRTLNQSEYALWKIESRSDILFPLMPRIWGLKLERPFQTWSRGMALQERALLQKYNLEKAVQITLLHLGLAEAISKMAITPSDVYLSESMKNRALEPYWKSTDASATTQQLENQFIGFLDDQGDKTSSARARSYLETIHQNLLQKTSHLSNWRLVQAFSIWNISSILGSLYFQTVSLLIVWITLSFYSQSPPTSTSALGKWGLIHLTFAIGPVAWMVSGWPAGGTFMILGITISWIIWFFMVYLSHKQLTLNGLTYSISQGLVMMLVSSGLVTLVASLALEFRIKISEGLLDWL